MQRRLDQRPVRIDDDVDEYDAQGGGGQGGMTPEAQQEQEEARQQQEERRQGMLLQVLQPQARERRKHSIPSMACMFLHVCVQ